MRVILININLFEIDFSQKNVFVNIWECCVEIGIWDSDNSIVTVETRC